MSDIRKKAIALTFLVSSSAAALAAGSAYMGITAGTNFGSGFYNTTATASGIDNPKGKLVSGVLGGYLWDKGRTQYGVELSGHFYKKNAWNITGKSYTMRSSTAGLAATMHYDFSANQGPRKGAYMLATAGFDWVFQKTKVNLDDPNDPLATPIGDNKSKLLPSVQAGFGYYFTPKVTADLVYKHIFGKKPDAAIIDGGGVDVTATKANFNKVASLSSIMLRLSYIF